MPASFGDNGTQLVFAEQNVGGAVSPAPCAHHFDEVHLCLREGGDAADSIFGSGHDQAAKVGTVSASHRQKRATDPKPWAWKAPALDSSRSLTITWAGPPQSAAEVTPEASSAEAC